MFSQQEVADRAGTSLFTIQRIERGEGNVRPSTGRGVAAALGIPIEELLPKAPYQVALDAVTRQAVQDRQAATRAFESERPQTYFKRHENEALIGLLKYSKDELADA